MNTLKKILRFGADPKAYFRSRVLAEVQREMEALGFNNIENIHDSDVIVAGYPKSGNTWVQQLMASILFELNPSTLPDILTQQLVPDVHAQKYYKRFRSEMCFKTHALPNPRYRRVIHLVRDGRDAMASYYAMNQAMGYPYTQEETVLDGAGLFPCKWADHCQAWLDNPFGAEVLTIKYESLLTEPVEQLSKICNFIGLGLPSDFLVSVANENSFEKTKQKEKKYGLYNPKFNPNGTFIRKGKVGTYKAEIDPQVLKEFEQQSYDMLKYFGYL